MTKIIEIPDSHFQRDPAEAHHHDDSDRATSAAEITSEEITAYYRRQRIPHPAISTLNFPCPTCYAAVDVWCWGRNNGDWHIPVCEARKAMYTAVYDRYMEAAKNGSLQVHTTPEDVIRKQIQTIIKEVITEYEQRKEFFIA